MTGRTRGLELSVLSVYIPIPDSCFFIVSLLFFFPCSVFFFRNKNLSSSNIQQLPHISVTQYTYFSVPVNSVEHSGLSLYVFIFCVCVCVFLYLCNDLSVGLFITINLSIYIYLFIYLSVNLSIYLSMFTSVYLSVYPVCLCICPCIENVVLYTWIFLVW